jgi:hypothetical protein
VKEKHIHIHSWIYCVLVTLEGNKKTNVLATCEGERGRVRETGEATLHVIYVHIAQKSQIIL